MENPPRLAADSRTEKESRRKGEERNVSASREHDS